MLLRTLKAKKCSAVRRASSGLEAENARIWSTTVYLMESHSLALDWACTLLDQLLPRKNTRTLLLLLRLSTKASDSSCSKMLSKTERMEGRLR